MTAKQSPGSIIIYSYPQFIYAWPMIVFGFLLAGLQSTGILGEGTVAWTYIIVVSLVTLTMGVDLGRNASIFCLVLFLGMWLGMLWLQDAKNVTFFCQFKRLHSRSASHHLLSYLSSAEQYPVDHLPDNDFLCLYQRPLAHHQQ